jgi:Integrase core domain
LTAKANALAESFVDSYKTELISDRVWRTRSQLELATAKWVAWFNHDRLHESLGDIPPVEFEQLHANASDALLDGPAAALPTRTANGFTTNRGVELAATGPSPSRERSGRSSEDPLRPRPRRSTDERPPLASPTGSRTDILADNNIKTNNTNDRGTHLIVLC